MLKFLQVKIFIVNTLLVKMIINKINNKDMELIKIVLFICFTTLLGLFSAKYFGMKNIKLSLQPNEIKIDIMEIVEMPNDTLDGNSNIETNFKKLKVSVLREMVYNKKLVDSKNKAKKLKKEQLINLLTA